MSAEPVVLEHFRTDPNKNPFGPQFQRYWEHRHKLFHRWDEGIKADEEALYSIKPEENALEIAATINAERVLDPYCGVGGVTIALARAGKRVIASDISPAKLEFARNNARLYGVEDKITFLEGDADDVFSEHAGQYEAIYLDPPWGGPKYRFASSFGFEDFSCGKLDLGGILVDAKHLEIAVSVPCNFDYNQVKRVNRPFKSIPYFLNPDAVHPKVNYYNFFMPPVS